MSLRTRLILAFLLLSVVPLSAVTLYSYSTSVHAFQRAVEREAAQSASDISHRMAMVTDDLGRRMDQLFDTPGGFPMNGDEMTTSEQQVRARLPMLGDVAALVDRVEFDPLPPVPDVRGRAGGPPAPGTPGLPPPPPVAPVPPARSSSAVVVDVGSILEATRKGIEATGVLPPEARAEMNKEMAKAIRESVEANIAKTEAMKAAAAAMSTPKPPSVVVVRREGHDVAIPVRRNGREVGRAHAQLNMDRTLNAILTLARSDQGEIPFAIDRHGQLYTPDSANRATLESLHVERTAAEGAPRRVGEWMVVTKKDESGLTFGVARPLGESLREIRRTSVRNLSLGLLVVGLAIVGIVPISHRMTERLRTLTGGVRQLAAGDFHARVPATSADEFGELARAFNQMAQDLEHHQALAIEQERLHRELELSRQIQTEMLPRAPLQFGGSEIKGISIPAREVGGDFFNYFELPGHRLGLLVGDVSGKGVSAALLMANVQATLRARLPLQDDLAALADLLDRELDESTPGGVFVTLFLATLDEAGQLRYVNAGHNPQYVLRVDGRVERLSSAGLPIGLFGGHGYRESTVALARGDLLFFYTDGLVEAENDRGDQFGSERVEAILIEEHAHGIDAVLERIERDVNAFRGAVEPMDDATLMALRV
jgi:serine phosphatase RsbU (regulator of sigma subunit)